MAVASDRRSFVREHPFLTAYLVALVVVWAITAATWTVRAGEAPALHPLAQVLQYLLVLVAAVLAALRLRVGTRETRDDARFGFYDLRWAIRDDIGGQTFWTALWVGAAAMMVNVILLAFADLVVGGASAGLGTYLEWLGAGLAAGAVLGMFGALLAAVIALAVRRRA